MADETGTPESPDPEETAEMVVFGEIVKSRAEQAYEQRRQGKQLAQIADDLGFAGPGDVSKAIESQMAVEAQYVSTRERHTILQMENDRLDELQAVYYQSAMLGDFKSLDAVLKIMDRRIKVNKLDAIDTRDQAHTVLIVGGDEEDYVTKLKQLD